MESERPETTHTALMRDVEQILPGDFELLEYVGEGGHGIVFKARNKTLHRIVAIKLIKNDGTDDSLKQFERMQNEARTLAKLSHQNIVKVFQFARCKDETPMLVCEFVNGETLASYLQRKKQLSLSELKVLFTQLADALTYSHEHGLVHRDIKPNNIMISDPSETKALHVKLLDFGIAREFEDAIQTPLGLTRTIQVTGSAPYMSPEQCAGRAIDQRSDIYSLACVLYECLAGRPPFVGETAVHTRYKQIHEKAKMPSENTDENIRAKSLIYSVVLKSLSKAPEDRQQSCAEFKKEFLQACESSNFKPQKSKRANKISKFWGGLVLGSLLASGLAWTALELKQKKEATKPLIALPSNSSEISVAKSLPGIKSLDPARRIAAIHKSVDNLHRLSANSVEDMREAFFDWEQLNLLISQLNQQKKGLLFSAWIDKALLAEALGKPQDTISCYEQALKYCRRSDGTETLEAAQCYCGIAKTLLKTDPDKSFKQIISMADRAYRLRLKLGDENCPVIEGEILSTDQSGGLWEPLQLKMFSLYNKRDYPAAERLAVEVIALRKAQYDQSETAHDVTSLAKIYWDQKKDDEAKLLILSFVEDVIAQRSLGSWNNYQSLITETKANDSALYRQVIELLVPYYQEHVKAFHSDVEKQNFEAAKSDYIGIK